MNTPNPIDLIERAYMAEPREWRFPLSGSSAGHCPRRLLRLLQGHRDTIDARSRRTFERGDQREEALASRLQKALEAQGYTCERQKDVWTTISTDQELADLLAARIHWIKGCPLRVTEEGIQIRSHCDLVAIPEPLEGRMTLERAEKLAPIQGRILVYEFKTANSYKFKSLKKGADLDFDYRAQLALQVAGLQPKEAIYETQWVYESKDTDDLFVIPFEPGGELEEVSSRIEGVLRAWLLSTDDYASPEFAAEDRRTEPEHKSAVACLPWQCTYCPVGPTAGNCVPGFRVEGIPYKDKQKWELYQE